MKPSPSFLLLLLLLSSFVRGEIPSSAWTTLEKRFADVRADYQKEEEDLTTEKEKEELEKEAVAYLRSLLIYESAVRTLADTEEDMSELGKIREFSSQERKNIEKLRKKIREADRQVILTALSKDTNLSGDEDDAESILKDELRLDGYFKSNTRKLASEISKLERELGKVIRKTNRDDPRRQKLKDEIAKLKEEIAVIHRAVFGFQYGCGFRKPINEAVKGDAATLLTKLIEERERVYAFLKDEQPDGGEGEEQAGVVGGSFLYSFNLGVVLDTSGSMTEHLEELRDEIANYFESPRYGEVVGCRLDSSHFEHLRSTRSSKTWATMSSIEELIAVRDVDTVYWFSDLQDAQDFMSLRRLRDLLMRGGTRLHVKSLGKQPSRELSDLIFDFQD